jgi:hypothetical protein
MVLLFRWTWTTVALNPKIVLILGTVLDILSLFVRHILGKPLLKPGALLLNQHEPVNEVSVFIVHQKRKASCFFGNVLPDERGRLSFSWIFHT